MIYPPLWYTFAVMIVGGVFSAIVWQCIVMERMWERTLAERRRPPHPAWDSGWFLLFLPIYVLAHVAWILA